MLNQAMTLVGNLFVHCILKTPMSTISFWYPRIYCTLHAAAFQINTSRANKARGRAQEGNGDMPLAGGAPPPCFGGAGSWMWVQRRLAVQRLRQDLSTAMHPSSLTKRYSLHPCCLKQQTTWETFIIPLETQSVYNLLVLKSFYANAHQWHRHTARSALLEKTRPSP